MKKTYLTPPEVRVGVQLQWEKCFLTATIIGGSTGEDLDDPDPFDPFS